MPYRLVLLCLTLCIASAQTTVASEVKPAPQTPPTSARSQEELIADIQKSMVVIKFLGRDGKPQGLGSGFVIDDTDLIATNMHVIGEARPILVEFSDGTTSKVVEVHATERSADLALLKVERTDLVGLPLAKEAAIQGQPILAFGNPRGLKFSVVAGVISGTRKIDQQEMLQIAIPIEQGNSGGPIVDSAGHVLGVVTLKSLETDNLGFATPVARLTSLIEKPNPIPMSRWLTIGVLNPQLWETRFGANWRQRAGRIQVSDAGSNFGGRTLCLSKIEPEADTFECSVEVKIDDPSGAAGLVFAADGQDKHYGFYPSNGKLRLSNFAGATVFTWQVLHEVASPAFQPGDWNLLKVRIDEGKVSCYCNDTLIVEHRLSSAWGTQVGLASFRGTNAQFRRFQQGERLINHRPTTEQLEQVIELINASNFTERKTSRIVDSIVDLDLHDLSVFEREAKKLEQRAERLRTIAKLSHQARTRQSLVDLLESDDVNDHLLVRASLLIAQIDNPEVDVKFYLAEISQWSRNLNALIKEQELVSIEERKSALHNFLFAELGFHGSRTDYDSRSNSYLNEVLDDREGIPLTLSIIYTTLARSIGLDAVGIGLPGHFVVGLRDGEELELIDVFERGTSMTKKAARQMVSGTYGVPWNDQFLQPLTTKQILARQLRNLLNLAQEEARTEAMLNYINTLIAIDSETIAADRGMRSVLLIEQGRIDDALIDIDWLFENAIDEFGEQRLLQLRAFADRRRQMQRSN